MSDYKISDKCCNYSKRLDPEYSTYQSKTCLKCGKCGRKFRKGILVDNTGKEFRKHIDEAMREENNGKSGI